MRRYHLKIVKVVHDLSGEEREREQQCFLLQLYDPQDFINRCRDQIQQQFDTDKPFGGKLTSNVAQAWLKGFVPGKKSAGQLMWEAVKNWWDTSQEKLIKITADTLLQDIRHRLSEAEIISLSIARKQYPKSTNLAIGTYTLHPYNAQMLVRLERFHQSLAEEKDDELITLLGRMGAKALRIVEQDTQEKSGSGQVKVETIKISPSVDVGIAQKIEKDKELLVIYEGNTVEIDHDLLERSLWFGTDSKLHAIFESRRFNANRIRQYTLKRTYTETFDFDFELAARYLVFQIDLKAEYESISKKMRLFHVEFG